MDMLSYGYLFGAVLMLVAAGVEWMIGVDAEQRGLESVARPLTAEPAVSADA